MISKVIRKIRLYVWKKNRNRLDCDERKRLTDKAKGASIISMNCNGGIISHNLGLRFLSPTVNLYMNAEDFIKFCEKLKYYLSVEKMVECKDSDVIGNRKYPVAYLDDLKLFLVHYNSVEEAQKKWDDRKKRINWDNVAILNTDREGMTDDLKERFEKLPYKKVMFVHKLDEKHPSCFYIKGYENENCVGIITDPEGWRGKRAIDQFDYVSFLNGKDCI